MRPSFWMVWNPNGRAPTYKHTEERHAKSEATRLALLHRGETFVVLLSVGEVSMPPLPQPEWIQHEGEIPF